MLFDAQAALADILKDEAPAIPAIPAIVAPPSPLESQKSRESRSQPAANTPTGAVVIHLARGLGLPTHPATCAVCGATDWRVCVRDAGGRPLHARCWKAERITRESKR